MIYLKKGALSLFFFIFYISSQGQEILWKGKELQSTFYKTIEGEITIRTSEDTVRASKAVIYQEPRKAVLKGNVTLTRKGTLVTGDSAVYFPKTKLVLILGHVVINSQEGVLRSESFIYDLNDKSLTSQEFAEGTANGIRFSADRCRIFTQSQNMKLWGNARWENDTVKGTADTIFLNRTDNTLKMSRKASINFKKKKDEIAGKLIELDLTTNKVIRIEGSKVKRDDVRLAAKKIKQEGDDYLLDDMVEIQSVDSSITTFGDKAILKKSGMKMTGNTRTRLVDKEKMETWIYAPQLVTRKDSGIERYQFFPKPNIRGQFEGFGDSISVEKMGKNQITTIYGHAHIQNDSLFVRADTLILDQIDSLEIIRARRNALMFMISRPHKVNMIQAANIQITKTEAQSELFAEGTVDSWLWNTEKENPGLNHTESATQKAQIKEKKISRVRTTGSTKSVFTPQPKVNMGYTEPGVVRLKDIYAADSIPKGISSIEPFWNYFKPKRISASKKTK